MRFVFVILGVLVLSMTAQAETEMTTDRLYELCAFDPQGHEIVPSGHTACQSYIIGVLDYFKTLKALDATTGVNICVDVEVPDLKLQESVVRYIGDNARHKNFLAAPTVALALQDSFPCESN